MTQFDAFSAPLKHIVQVVLKAVEQDIIVSALTEECITDMDQLIILERNFETDPLKITSRLGGKF